MAVYLGFTSSTCDVNPEECYTQAKLNKFLWVTAGIVAMGLLAVGVFGGLEMTKSLQVRRMREERAAIKRAAIKRAAIKREARASRKARASRLNFRYFVVLVLHLHICSNKPTYI